VRTLAAAEIASFACLMPEIRSWNPSFSSAGE
jgi:hypothetical protein